MCYLPKNLPSLDIVCSSVGVVTRKLELEQETCGVAFWRAISREEKSRVRPPNKPNDCLHAHVGRCCLFVCYIIIMQQQRANFCLYANVCFVFCYSFDCVNLWASLLFVFQLFICSYFGCLMRQKIVAAQVLGSCAPFNLLHNKWPPLLLVGFQ